MTQVIREETIAPVHPEFYEGWTRVDKADHPGVGALYDGAPDLGWSGDPRLCLYRNALENCYILVRLEHDGVYRQIIRSPRGELLSPESMNRLIHKLISVDRNRGVDLIAMTQGENERVLALEETAEAGWRHEAADRLVYWMIHAHLPQIDNVPYLR